MKKVKKLFVLCALAFMLCGCLKADYNIKVNADGTADLSVTMLVQDSMLSMAGGTDGLKESLTSNIDEDSITLKEISKTYDGEEYKGFEITYKGDTKDAGLDNLKEMVKITDDKAIFTMNESSLAALSSGLGDEYESMEGIEFNLNVTMPGKITKNNCGEIDGNTVKINLLKNKEATVEIESSLGNDNTIIIVCAVIAVIVIAGGVFFFMKKKKNNKDDGNNDELRPIDPNAPVAPETTEETQENTPVEIVEETVTENETTEEVVENEATEEVVEESTVEVVESETKEENK